MWYLILYSNIATTAQEKAISIERRQQRWSCNSKTLLFDYRRRSEFWERMVSIF